MPRPACLPVLWQYRGCIIGELSFVTTKSGDRVTGDKKRGALDSFSVHAILDLFRASPRIYLQYWFFWIRIVVFLLTTSFIFTLALASQTFSDHFDETFFSFVIPPCQKLAKASNIQFFHPVLKYIYIIYSFCQRKTWILGCGRKLLIKCAYRVNQKMQMPKIARFESNFFAEFFFYL